MREAETVNVLLNGEPGIYALLQSSGTGSSGPSWMCRGARALSNFRVSQRARGFQLHAMRKECALLQTKEEDDCNVLLFAI